jgi:glycosyltransferase involved in cell wall biosynthesis
MTKIMLFSRVGSPRLFSRMGFYRADVEALRQQGALVLLGSTLNSVAFRRFDALLAYFYTWGSLAAVLARLRGRRVVLTGGADEFSNDAASCGLKGLWRRAMLWCGLLAAHRVLLPSASDRENIRRHCRPIGWLVDRKLLIAPHPLPRAGCMRSPAAREWRAVTICWMGTVANVERKGIPATLRAIAKLRRSGDPMPLDIIGTTGPGTAHVEALVAALGLGDLVSIRGAVSENDKWGFLQSAEVYFQLSTYEGFGVAALEALSASCVVVHTGKGGLRETLGDDGIRLTPAQVSGDRSFEGLGDLIRGKRAELAGRASAIQSRLVETYSLPSRGRALAAALGLPPASPAPSDWRRE